MLIVRDVSAGGLRGRRHTPSTLRRQTSAYTASSTSTTGTTTSVAALKISTDLSKISFNFQNFPQILKFEFRLNFN
jgi:hypothetical protein